MFKLSVFAVAIVFSNPSLCQLLSAEDFQSGMGGHLTLPQGSQLATNSGRWCTMGFQSSIGKVLGLGSPLYSLSSQDAIHAKTLFGMLQAYRIYQFLVRDERLFVEVRDIQSHGLICTLESENKTIHAQGSWIFPYGRGPLEGLDLCTVPSITINQPNQRAYPVQATIECE